MAVAAIAALAAPLEALIALEAVNNLVMLLVQQIVAAALAPELLELQQESFKLTNTRALDPSLSIEAFIKGHRTDKQSMDDVAAYGYDGELWRAMADSAGEPLPLQLAMEAWRRGIIPRRSDDPNTPSLEKAIRDSRLKNVWTASVEALQFQVAPVGTIIEAWLRAQILPADALKLAYQQGVDEYTATLMYKSAGRPPSPQELATMWHRGIITEGPAGGDNLTLAQGYKETDLKDKWYDKWRDSLEYRPPPRTITALHRSGALTDAQALQLYKEEGLSDAMAAIYVKTAHHERTAAAKDLTKAEWLTMYVDQAISAEDLKAKLEGLGFGGESADLEIQLADLRITHALEQRAVNRIGTLYTGRKVSKQQAMNTLDSLKLPAAQRDRLLKIWDLERGDNVRHLGPVTIAQAIKDQFISPAEGLEMMAAQGFGPRDAWLELSVHLKGGVTDNIPSDNLPPA